MEETELQRLWLAEEDEHFERKAKVNLENVDSIRKTICAFANNLSRSEKPGVLIIGQNDDKSCSNLDITDELKLKLTQHDNVLPFPSVNLQEFSVNGCKAIALIVQPSGVRPVDYSNAAYVRRGPQTVKANRADLSRLEEHQRWSTKSFELRSVIGSMINELKLGWFQDEYLPQAINKETLDENHREVTDWLRNQKFIDAAGVPTVVGILAAGKVPLDYLPGAYIQAVKFTGVLNEPDDVIDQKQIQGTIAQQFSESIRLIELWNQKSSTMTDFKRTDHYAIPPRALREIMANAIIHRNYESNSPIRFFWFKDRVEISNPGGPYGEVKLENFANEKDTGYRNPVLAAVVKNLGFIDKFGSGIGKAKRDMVENGNPPIEFDPTEDSVRIALPLRKD